MTSPTVVIDSFGGRWRGLSNFAPARIVVPDPAGDVACPTAEHAYNVLKTENRDARLWVAAATTPGEAKRRGRQVPLRPWWDERYRYHAMRWTLARKFALTEHAALLAASGDAILIEGNTWHDGTWGDCRCGRPACAAPGHNLLGWMLMEHRDTGPATLTGLRSHPRDHLKDETTR
jgi:predicted NAD-dependent protein-ADP-ribosyltransferase YbiA (DUF1768 family)